MSKRTHPHNPSSPLLRAGASKSQRHRRLASGALLAAALTGAGPGALPAAVASTSRALGTPGANRAGVTSQHLMIFMANYDASDIVEYPLQGRSSSPKVTLSNDIEQPQGITFDPAGDLWVANAGSLLEFAKSELENPSASPTRNILGGTEFAGLAFDSSGNLWVDDYGAADVVEYTKSQLSGATEAPIAAVTIYNSDFSAPFGLAFDRKGDLWIGNENNGQILEFTKSELDKSGSPVPKLDLNATGQVEQVVFDSAGNLWTTNGQGGDVVEYTMAQLHGTTAPAPAISISPGLSWPGGLYFDPAGDLWVTDYSGQQLVELSKAQLRSSGSVTPVRAITEASGGPVAVAIGP